MNWGFAKARVVEKYPMAQKALDTRAEMRQPAETLLHLGIISPFLC